MVAAAFSKWKCGVYWVFPKPLVIMPEFDKKIGWSLKFRKPLKIAHWLSS